MTAGAALGTLARLDALAADRGIPLERDARLAPYTTLRVGGSADRLATPRTRDELLATLALARDAGTPLFLLGNGSDLVVADAGIRGLVIRNRARSVETNGTSLRADAGASMAMLVKRCTADGLAGLEFGISIPGSLGGAVWANAGAHAGEMAIVLRRAEVWDPADGSLRQLATGECAFAYRESRFKHSSEVILAATLELRRGDPARIAALVDEDQAVRRATQPLADQNAGSIFRNPAGDHAGRLIDAAGLKGARVGSAQVSTLHANFIVTDREGRGTDVRALGEHVRAVVAERFGVELRYEVEFVGDWQDPETAR
jgi:UDP-N-acetylmuramate dehydrogenase